MRSRCRCSMCPAIHINSRSWLRSSSTHEPSDPPLRVVICRYFGICSLLPAVTRQWSLAERDHWGPRPKWVPYRTPMEVEKKCVRGGRTVRTIGSLNLRTHKRERASLGYWEPPALSLLPGRDAERGLFPETGTPNSVIFQQSHSSTASFRKHLTQTGRTGAPPRQPL